MLSAKIVNAGLPDEDIEIAGTLEEGEKIPGFCCRGFDWEVNSIFSDSSPAYVNYWGGCYNPDCPVNADADFWSGVKNVHGDTIAEWLLDRQLA